MITKHNNCYQEWEVAEIQRGVELGETDAEIASRLPERSVASVKNFRQRHGLLKAETLPDRDRRIEEMDAAVSDAYEAGASDTEIAEALGVSLDTVKSSRRRQGLSRSKAWTAEEDARLTVYRHRGKTLPEIAKIMNKTPESVTRRWYRLRTAG